VVETLDLVGKTVSTGINQWAATFSSWVADVSTSLESSSGWNADADAEG
jgi:hypothetical protein